MAKPITLEHRKTGKITVCDSIRAAADKIGMTRETLSKRYSNADENNLTTNTFYHGEYKVFLCVEKKE